MFSRNLVLLSVSSYGFAILIVLISSICPIIRAEYDCSAKDDGWYYDPEFCHIYWRCTHGTAEEFECASGTAWDHHENRCNWLDSVDCSRAEKTTEKISSDEETQDDGDGDEQVDEEEEEEEPVVVVKKKKKSNRKRKMKEDDDDNDEPICLTICQANLNAELFCAGREGFFAHPDYCTRYYRCAHGVDQGFECPKGTAWDDETKSCAWVEHVNCEEKKVDYSTTSPTTEDSTTSHKKLSTEPIVSDAQVVQLTQGKDSSGIECQPTGIYTIADLNDCNAYYQCNRGIRTRLNCPERELFDANKHQCLDYERVACGSRAVNLADKNQCVNKRDGIHPDTERDCRFYYQCVGQNKMREAKCPGDQKFSSYTSKCGPASNAPVPCGTYIPGSATISYHQNLGLVICIVLFTVFIIV